MALLVFPRRIEGGGAGGANKRSEKRGFVSIFEENGVVAGLTELTKGREREVLLVFPRRLEWLRVWRS